MRFVEKRETLSFFLGGIGRRQWAGAVPLAIGVSQWDGSIIPSSFVQQKTYGPGSAHHASEDTQEGRYTEGNVCSSQEKALFHTSVVQRLSS